ncbi:MAG: hypothetical protein QOJ98_2365 [Acidobacteriota bacterium]|jgi:hypothetical protein|nr:hypothetical protein [Acidobacteriota bacterium]
MSSLRLVIALLLAALPLRAQEVSTTIVPVVGSVFGASMVRWLTDVELVNEGALDVDVAIELPSVPVSAPIFFTLSPGQSQRFTDIVGQAFGLEHALSPLRVTSSRRGVTVRAQAYAITGAGISFPQRIDVYQGSTYFPVRVLDGLAFSDNYRTNVGLVNVGEQSADFLLALQRIPGRSVAVTHMRVNPGSVVHVAIQSLFPLITSGNGFSIVIETNARDTHVYGSVIESSTSSARFITPRVGAR